MDWIWSDPTTLALVPLTALAVYLGLIVATRLAGLRSFSKLSSFDFAITVAIGSLMASTISAPTPTLVQGLLALATLYLIQYGVARLRVGGSVVAFDNAPLLLMDGDGMLRENMRAARVTEHDLLAKLREANVLRFSQVRAVVLESTGDVSVLHGEDGELEERLLDGVRPSHQSSSTR